MTAPFIAIGYAADVRMPLHYLADTDRAAQWSVDVEIYHRGLNREAMWTRARQEGSGNVADDVRDWCEFMADWRGAHPAGYDGSFCESFEVDRVEVSRAQGNFSENYLP